jgi:hypothetical protein
LKSGKTVEEIQKEVPKSTMKMISSINNGYTWKDSSYDYPISKLNGVKKFTDEEVINIRKLRYNGLSTVEIANLYNTETSSVSSITTGEIRKNVGGPISKKQNRNLLSKEEVESCRKFYAENNISIKELWNNFTKKNNNPIGYSSFKQMIEGKTYSQYKIFKRKDFTKERDSIIKELNNQKINKKQIAKMVGCSERTVYRVLQENE